MPPTCSSDDNLIKILERPNSCGCTASECDTFTRGKTISTTIQEDSVADRYIVEKAPLDPVDVTSQEVTETLNLLVNDRSSVVAYTIDLIVPPKLTS